MNDPFTLVGQIRMARGVVFRKAPQRPPKAFPELRATSASSQVLVFLRELAEKMRVVLAYDPAMTIRANEVACDAYNLRRNEYVETADKTFRMKYFLKFALSKTSKLVLMVSCHT